MTSAPSLCLERWPRAFVDSELQPCVLFLALLVLIDPPDCLQLQRGFGRCCGSPSQGIGQTRSSCDGNFLSSFVEVSLKFKKNSGVHLHVGCFLGHQSEKLVILH